MISLEISSFILSTIVPYLSEKFGRKNIIVSGYVTIVLATIALSFTEHIDTPGAYFWIAVACRFM